MADKRKLLKDADEADSELREAVSGLSELEMSRVWLGTWGAREILIHIAAWDREMIPALQRVGRGEPPYAAGASDDGGGRDARLRGGRRGRGWGRLDRALRGGAAGRQCARNPGRAGRQSRGLRGRRGGAARGSLY